MAASEHGGKPKATSYAFIHKLSAGAALLAFVVIVLAGVMAQSSITMMVLRAVVVIAVVSLVKRVIIRILASYEEMNSGKA